MKNLMETLRHLATDTTLDAHERLRGADDAIKGYLPTAKRNPIKRRHMLQDLDVEVAAEMSPMKANDFWTGVRDIISQLLKQLPDGEQRFLKNL
jgi:hypothetical protein